MPGSVPPGPRGGRLRCFPELPPGATSADLAVSFRLLVDVLKELNWNVSGAPLDVEERAERPGDALRLLDAEPFGDRLRERVECGRVDGDFYVERCERFLDDRGDPRARNLPGERDVDPCVAVFVAERIRLFRQARRDDRVSHWHLQRRGLCLCVDRRDADRRGRTVVRRKRGFLRSITLLHILLTSFVLLRLTCLVLL